MKPTKKTLRMPNYFITRGFGVRSVFFRPAGSLPLVADNELRHWNPRAEKREKKWSRGEESFHEVGIDITRDEFV
jgi:hypothetical protein